MDTVLYILVGAALGMFIGLLIGCAIIRIFDL